MSDDVLMTVLDIRVELPGNQPVVLLHDPVRDVLVRLWVGAPEASAIAMAQHRVQTPRPMTHQLLVSGLEQSGAPLTAVRIHSVEDDVFHAELVLSNGAKVDSRASDAIACALLADVEVYCSNTVLKDASVPVESTSLTDEEQLDQLQRVHEQEEQSLDEFREFLDHVTPDDFADDSGDQPDSDRD